MEPQARLRASSTRYGEIRGRSFCWARPVPDCAALHPGYEPVIAGGDMMQISETLYQPKHALGQGPWNLIIWAK
jgi:hypothetical protein